MLLVAHTYVAAGICFSSDSPGEVILRAVTLESWIVAVFVMDNRFVAHSRALPLLIRSLGPRLKVVDVPVDTISC